MADSASIVEIFSSIQGEGLCIGERQIFIRFFPCNLSCNYCDTPTKESSVKDCIVELTPGRADCEKIKNPIESGKLSEIVKNIVERSGKHHSISLTGGEPLLQCEFLKEWLPSMKETIYLETNGTLHGELGEIIEEIDIISMDIKLPDTAGIMPVWDEHEAFLKIAHKKNVFVKVVVSNETGHEEFDMAVDMVSSRDKKIPFIIQPVTEEEESGQMPSPYQLFEFHGKASTRLDEVRVIPQSHKMMGIL